MERGSMGVYETGRPMGRWVHAKIDYHRGKSFGGRNDADRECPGAADTGGEGCTGPRCWRSEGACGEDGTSSQATDPECPDAQDTERQSQLCARNESRDQPAEAERR